MHRPRSVARPRTICQICESISSQRRRVATPLIAARNASQHPYRSRRATSPLISPHSRTLSSAVLPRSKRAPAEKAALGDNARVETDHGASSATPPPSLSPSSIADIMSYLKTSVSKVSTARGIPSEKNVSDALTVCEWLATWFTDESVRPQIAHAISELDSTASTLLSLDGGESERTKTAIETTMPPSQLPEGIEYSAKLHEVINKISETAYLILAHPPVLITPNLLEQYVRVQDMLGRPETLPKVFQLFASKPLPREGSVPLSYTKQNPNRAENAIESKTVDAALDTAIAAKNLDAAVGIIENSYGTMAFVRSKLLRHGLLPLGTLAVTPIAAYILATNFSGLQQSMDSATATTVAFTGILAYVGFTASLGVVALTTANDQMKRVTWAPGMPLRKRWIREEERAALDKIACAWGFQESRRQGEEEGADWDALREYISQKGMILDRTELMEGMD
ncbi:hypothetical protein E0Z10_g9427 [Xylaria hypoxylon]|uniref:Uncharacterized protein n=1 Tax=Xylaria hypoxylon TaxID=37992 RepID=A0A4Z0YL14_9PEZI|nr:hypothetical protein E0Z10_g9427 [Xylaria hypoxylon]